MARPRFISIFRRDTASDFPIRGLNGGLNTTYSEQDILDNELSGGQNVRIDTIGNISKRDGISLVGNFLGTTTGILWGDQFTNISGTQEELVVWDTSVYRLVSTTWTALTGITLTSNLKADGVFFPFENAYYITNGTDNVARYASGSSGTQDATIPKGKYVEHFQNRLFVANVSGEENRVYYSNNQSDTFTTATDWFQVDGEVTGLQEYNGKLYVFTSKKIFRIANFAWDGSDDWINELETLPVEFGAIYDRTIKIVNGFIYFLGLDADDVASIYAFDGYNAVSVSDQRIRGTLNGLAPSQLETSCAVADGLKYRVHFAESGQTTNNIGIIYDTSNKIFFPIEKRLTDGVADFAVMWIRESSGTITVRGGTQGTGQVYTINSGLNYDSLPDERYIASGTHNIPIQANPAKRVAQSFKLSNYNTTETVGIATVALRLRKLSGTTTDLQLRIETDSSGVPSGTAVTNGTVTISAFTDTSYVWKTVSFATAPNLTGNTTYWLVLQHVTEDTGNSVYEWLGDPCTPSYTNGNLATDTGVAYLKGNAKSIANHENICALSSTRVVVGSTSLSEAQLYDFDGTDWTEVGNALDRNPNSMVALSSSRIVLIDEDINERLYTFDFDGLNWTSVGNSLSIPSINGSSIAKLSSTRIAITDSAANTLTTYDFDGTDWTQVGNALTITSMGTPSVTALSSTRVAYIDSTNDSLRTYDFDGTNWTLTGSGLTVSTSGVPSITALSSTKVAFVDSTNDAIRVYSFNGSTWSQYRSSTNIGSIGGPSISALSSTRIAFFDSTNDELRAYDLSWRPDTSVDQLFILYSQAAIDAYFDTKAYSIAGLGNGYKLHQFKAIFETTGNYNMEIGFNRGSRTSFDTTQVSLASESSNTWGGGGTWGSGLIWGGGSENRVFITKSVSSFTGELVKMRVRNRKANQPFNFNSCVLRYTQKYRRT